MMKLQQRLSGTTTVGFPFGQGIMLGVDARISNSYMDEDKNLYEEISKLFFVFLYIEHKPHTYSCLGYDSSTKNACFFSLALERMLVFIIFIVISYIYLQNAVIMKFCIARMVTCCTLLALVRSLVS